jgi:hypothetical protein
MVKAHGFSCGLTYGLDCVPIYKALYVRRGVATSREGPGDRTTATVLVSIGQRAAKNQRRAAKNQRRAAKNRTAVR